MSLTAANLGNYPTFQFFTSVSLHILVRRQDPGHRVKDAQTMNNARTEESKREMCPMRYKLVGFFWTEIFRVGHTTTKLLPSDSSQGQRQSIVPGLAHDRLGLFHSTSLQSDI